MEARPTVLILGSPAPAHLPERAILEPLAEVVYNPVQRGEETVRRGARRGCGDDRVADFRRAADRQHAPLPDHLPLRDRLRQHRCRRRHRGRDLGGAGARLRLGGGVRSRHGPVPGLCPRSRFPGPQGARRTARPPTPDVPRQGPHVRGDRLRRHRPRRDPQAGRFAWRASWCTTRT